jgi:deoxyribonucleoside regulator
MADYQDRSELLARVASLYYDHNKNQREIASEIGVTRSAVSRLLTEARKRGIVEYIIHYPYRTSAELEKALIDTFNLKYVRVLIRQNRNLEEMVAALGILASQYFVSILPDLKIVGIGWGTGLYQMVRAVRPQPRPDMEVIQLLGGTGMERGSAIGPLLAPNLANTLGCTCRFLHAPLFMENQASRDMLLQERSIRETLKRAKKCDIAVLGLGAILPELYNPYKLGYITKTELNQMRANGIVGDVAGFHYNRRGEILIDHWINRRIVGIAPEALSKIKLVMAVAGGLRKGESIIGALRGNLINILITDDQAALRVLQLHQESLAGRN